MYLVTLIGVFYPTTDCDVILSILSKYKAATNNVFCFVKPETVGADPSPQRKSAEENGRETKCSKQADGQTVQRAAG